MALAGPTIATPPLAAESPPGSPVPAALSPSKQAGPQRARPARLRERPQRYVQGAYGRRSGFVESVLFSRHSMF
jgi:hypothetical protein